MKFYIIRHGKTALNDSGRITGQTDVPITEEGVLQITEAASALPGDIVALYSSDLIRARQTAEILNNGRNLPLTYDSRLRERSFGSLEGLEWDVCDPDGTLRTWDDSQKYDYTKFGGESVEDVRQRLFASLKEISDKEDGRPVLIVAHGGIIRLLHRMYNMGTDPIKNGSLHEFNINI